jgi:hypothetical protein
MTLAARTGGRRRASGWGTLARGPSLPCWSAAVRINTKTLLLPQPSRAQADHPAVPGRRKPTPKIPRRAVVGGLGHSLPGKHQKSRQDTRRGDVRQLASIHVLLLFRGSKSGPPWPGSPRAAFRCAETHSLPGRRGILGERGLPPANTCATRPSARDKSTSPGSGRPKDHSHDGIPIGNFISSAMPDRLPGVRESVTPKDS